MSEKTTTGGLDFVSDALRSGALIFGDFRAKSGRRTPYFFNSSALLSSSRLLRDAAQRCAELVATRQDDFDALFGAAYKGIPLATSTAMCLLNKHGIDKPLAFDRKEAKKHGEGGRFVGASLHKQRVILLDDVLTTGAALMSILPALKKMRADVVGLVVLFDRQEVTMQGQATRPFLENTYGVKTQAVARFQDLLSCRDSSGKASLSQEQLSILKAYQAQYGY